MAASNDPFSSKFPGADGADFVKGSVKLASRGEAAEKAHSVWSAERKRKETEEFHAHTLSAPTGIYILQGRQLRMVNPILQTFWLQGPLTAEHGFPGPDFGKDPQRSGLSGHREGAEETAAGRPRKLLHRQPIELDE